jgi:uncharacterized protein
MPSADSLIKQLNLTRHPEGGYYRETYRSATTIPANVLNSFGGGRNISTSIYFLLPFSERSLFHRIKSDEIWHYHAGSPLSIYVLNNGTMHVHKLGPNIGDGENFQVVVPANSWFGAICETRDSFTLSGCTVAPGFDFQDFELGSRDKLTKEFPRYTKEIRLLTKPE